MLWLFSVFFGCLMHILLILYIFLGTFVPFRVFISPSNCFQSHFGCFYFPEDHFSLIGFFFVHIFGCFVWFCSYFWWFYVTSGHFASHFGNFVALFNLSVSLFSFLSHFVCFFNVTEVVLCNFWLFIYFFLMFLQNSILNTCSWLCLPH